MPQKTIVIDASPLASGHSTRGTGVYTKNLIRSLEKVSKDITIEAISNMEEVGIHCDLIHYPYFDLFFHSLPIFKKAKTVVTIHDVTPLLYPQYYPPGIKGKINFLLQKQALRSVDRVLTVSETSKKDIVRFLDVPEGKIEVTYEAPNFEFKKQPNNVLHKIRQRYKLPQEFVLYIGDVNWNKNIINLVKAVKLAKTTLVIVGKSATNTDYDKSHRENQPLKILQEKYGEDPEVLRLGFLEDQELNAVWQMASVYCMPSIYEGFGLPVVEAIAAGVPVVCARTQALVEIAGDAAVYFDPRDTKNMANTIRKVLNDRMLKKDLITKAKKHIAKYSWDKTAKQTLQLYKKVLNI